MAISLIIAFIILMVVFKVFHLGDTFSPWMITTAVWTGYILTYLFFSDLLVPLETRFYTCALIWVPTMSLSSILTYQCWPTNDSPRGINAPLHVNASMFDLLFVLSLLLTPLYAYQILKIVLEFGSEDIMYNIRIFANFGKEGGGLTGVLKYVNSINTALFIIALWRFPDIPRWKFITIALTNLICALSIMAKQPIFVMLFATLFVFYQKKYVKPRAIILWGAALIMLFYGFNQLRTSENSQTERTFFDFIAIYILSPAAAFERADIDLTDQFGTHTLAFFNAVLSKLHLADVYVEETVQPFVWIPLPTNVYTAFQPFYEDFGYKGIAFFATVYGVLFGWLYRKAHSGSSTSKCMYAYITVVLMLQFFQEQFFVTLSTIIQLAVLFLLATQSTIRFRWPDSHRQPNNTSPS
jgi:oligosaccharide repeat unit polymerase